MSNGIILFKGKTMAFQCTFGMMSIEEISNRQATGASGWYKLITDIIYGGYMNDRHLEGVAPEYTYRQIAAEVELILEDEGSTAIAEVFKCFNESKAGIALNESVKKKIAEQKSQKSKKSSIGTK